MPAAQEIHRALDKVHDRKSFLQGFLAETLDWPIAQGIEDPEEISYAWSEEESTYRPFALNVLTLRGEQVSDVTAFIARSAEPREGTAFERYPDEPLDVLKVGAVFGRFGLPAKLD